MRRHYRDYLEEVRRDAMIDGGLRVWEGVVHTISLGNLTCEAEWILFGLREGEFPKPVEIVSCFRPRLVKESLYGRLCMFLLGLCQIWEGCVKVVSVGYHRPELVEWFLLESGIPDKCK